jgi:ubiquinone/menaquinone biosynthesis C-methylase UbiE
LDIGVGTGKTLFLFCGNFEESTGIDVSDAMLDIAKKNAQ